MHNGRNTDHYILNHNGRKIDHYILNHNGRNIDHYILNHNGRNIDHYILNHNGRNIDHYILNHNGRNIDHYILNHNGRNIDHYILYQWLVEGNLNYIIYMQVQIICHVTFIYKVHVYHNDTHVHVCKLFYKYMQIHMIWIYVSLNHGPSNVI